MERPILFSTPMVQAILDGRKSQTRRIVKIPDLIKEPDRYYYLGNSNDLDIPRKAIPYDERVYHAWRLNNNNMPMWVDYCPYGKVGDILWVRETWNYLLDENLDCCGFCYKASSETFEGLEPFDGPKWKPSIHMPKVACRIRLEITNIRVERVQDIDELDALAEGITSFTKDGVGFKFGLDGWNWGYQSGHPFMCSNPEIAYSELWESINGKDSWDINPWVWVISFERIA